MSLTREQILSAEDRDFEDVNVPAWGGDLRLVAPSGSNRETLLVQWQSEDQDDLDPVAKTSRMYPVLIAAMAHEVLPNGDTGEQLFSEDDVAHLYKKNGAVLEDIAIKAMKLAGFTADASEEGEDD